MNLQYSKNILYSFVDRAMHAGWCSSIFTLVQRLCVFIKYIRHLVFNDVRMTPATPFSRGSSSIPGSERTTYRWLVGAIAASTAHLHVGIGDWLVTEEGHRLPYVQTLGSGNYILANHIRGGTAPRCWNGLHYGEILVVFCHKTRQKPAYRHTQTAPRPSESRLVDIRCWDNPYEIILLIK